MNCINSIDFSARPIDINATQVTIEISEQHGGGGHGTQNPITPVVEKVWHPTSTPTSVITGMRNKPPCQLFSKML